MTAVFGRGALVLCVAVGALIGCSDGGDQVSSEPTCADKVLTVTTDAGGQFSEPTLPNGDGQLASMVAESFCSPVWTASSPDGSEVSFRSRPLLTGGEASCIGSGLVEALGADRLRELNAFGTGPWSTLGFGLSQNEGDKPATRADAEAIADVFIGCTDSWKLLLALSVTEGAKEIGDESAGCIDARLDADAARTMLVGELDRAYDDPAQPDATPFPDLIQPLVDVFEQCLTPEEQAQLDFS